MKMSPGMRVIAQIAAIGPFSIVLSLPHKLFGYVPIDKISNHISNLLKESNDHGNSSLDEDDTSERDDLSSTHESPPELEEIFSVGQYVRAIVSAIHPQGTIQPSDSAIPLGRPKSEVEKESRRVELSLLPHEVNAGISVKDLAKGMVLPAYVSSVEDHGYTIDFGISGVTGFLAFKDAENVQHQQESPSRRKIGSVINVRVKKMEDTGRLCTVSMDIKVVTGELAHLTSTSAVHPGTLVKVLVTGSSSAGVNVQILGAFEGTIHPLHLSRDAMMAKPGDKIRARIIWEVPGSDPKRFALSTLPHILNLQPRRLVTSNIQDDDSDAGLEERSIENAYPISTFLDNVKVMSVDSDRGLYVGVADGLLGSVHISDVSDEHVPSLSASSGPYKSGTVHRARVIGFYPFDGVLKCSMKESILQQKWLRVEEVQVGETVKGTINSLTDRGLFVSISGSVHAVIWPNHYADIHLKHPERKFKIGNSIKCRVLVVEPAKNRICLTAKRTLLESTLPIISSVDDVQRGMITHAVIFKISERILTVEFYNNVKGIIPLKEATETFTQTLDQQFHVGQAVKVQIIDIKSETSLPVASILKATRSEEVQLGADMSNIDPSQPVCGIVHDIHQDNVVLKLTPTNVTALLSIRSLARSRQITVEQLRITLDVGDKIDNLTVAVKNEEKGIVIVNIKSKSNKERDKKGIKGLDKTAKGPENEEQKSQRRQPGSFEDLKIGQILWGTVSKHTSRGAIVKMPTRLFAKLHMTEISDDYSSVILPPIGDSVKVAIIAIDTANKSIQVSTRASQLYSQSEGQISAPDPRISDAETLKIGQSVRGFVTNVAEQDLFIALSPTLDARVQRRELFDEYVKDWRSRFSVNQLVQGRILSVDRDKCQVEVTLRSRDAQRILESKKLSDYTVGQRVDGVIKRIEEYGAFIQIKDTRITSLCHKSELTDDANAAPDEVLASLQVGDFVRALIVSIDQENGRISLSLKPSHFFQEDLMEEEEDRMVVDHNVESSATDDDVDSEDEDIVLDGISETENGEQVDTASKPSGSVPTLVVPTPLRWDAGQDDNADSVEGMSSDEEEFPKKKKRKHMIQQDLTVDLHTRTPQSTNDFERLLLSSPNSSYLWLQFMAFQLQLSEIEKAREIGRRALRAVNFREEQERLNVWIGLLNLEVTYGTDTTLDAVFKDAARANDSKTIHWRLAVMLDDSQRHERAEEQFKKTCKKFGTSSKVWTLFAEHYFKRSMPDEARQLLQRSLLSLEKRKHLKTISKFAQSEYRMGEPERGRTIFEGIIDTHPKRLDLWNIYIDMEAGQNDIQRIRNICDRALGMKLSKKKAKFFFKKWLELEKKLGDATSADKVIKRAIEWTQNSGSSAT
ncbi:rRNA biogenesis protein rrp5 [Serendipita sp. 407]|nr:rRNA biogenesis protein rrp5 [Serendipita sp. 407]